MRIRRLRLLAGAAPVQSLQLRGSMLQAEAY
jgi:hypothetical protein